MNLTKFTTGQLFAAASKGADSRMWPAVRTEIERRLMAVAPPSRLALMQTICAAFDDDWYREGPEGLTEAYGPVADAVLKLFGGEG